MEVIRETMRELEIITTPEWLSMQWQRLQEVHEKDLNWTTFKCDEALQNCINDIINCKTKKLEYNIMQSIKDKSSAERLKA